MAPFCPPPWQASVPWHAPTGLLHPRRDIYPYAPAGEQLPAPRRQVLPRWLRPPPSSGAACRRRPCGSTALSPFGLPAPHRPTLLRYRRSPPPAPAPPGRAGAHFTAWPLSPLGCGFHHPQVFQRSLSSEDWGSGYRTPLTRLETRPGTAGNGGPTGASLQDRQTYTHPLPCSAHDTGSNPPHRLQLQPRNSSNSLPRRVRTFRPGRRTYKQMQTACVTKDCGTCERASYASSLICSSPTLSNRQGMIPCHCNVTVQMPMVTMVPLPLVTGLIPLAAHSLHCSVPDLP